MQENVVCVFMKRSVMQYIDERHEVFCFVNYHIR